MRDIRIDILRFIGLAMIILAHVGPPETLDQIRNFDVPMMVLIAGMSFGISYKPDLSYSVYFIKRVVRLIGPVWIFLSFYFLFAVLFDPDSNQLNFKTVITSYGLISGIGYVWIIRIFVMVALMSPFIFLADKKINSTLKYFSCIAFGFLVFEMIRFFTNPYIEAEPLKLISLFTHYLLPYSLIFAIGLRLPKLNKKYLLFIGGLNGVIFIACAAVMYVIYERFVPTQEFKYPPSYYYVSYAIMVSILLWLCAEQISALFNTLKVNGLVLFTAQNSIWIYLWHIMFLQYYYFLASTFSLSGFLMKYLCVFVLSIAVTYIQVFLVKKFILPLFKSQKVKKNIYALLTG